MWDLLIKQWQLIGWIALVFSTLSFQQKKRSRIMTLQTTASLLGAVHLFVTGGVTGAYLDLISTGRTLLFTQREKKWLQSPLWLWGIILTMLIVGLATLDGNYWNLLPIAGSVLSTLSLWMKKENLIRFISLFAGPCWILYYFTMKYINYPGIVQEAIAMTSIVIGILRHDLPGKKEKEPVTK